MAGCSPMPAARGTKLRNWLGEPFLNAKAPGRSLVRVQGLGARVEG